MLEFVPLTPSNFGIFIDNILASEGAFPAELREKSGILY